MLLKCSEAASEKFINTQPVCTDMAVLDEYTQDFAILDDRERFMYLIELGEELPPYPEEYKTKQYQVSGCQSLVYIALIPEENNITIHGYADAKVVKGYLRILIEALQNKTAKEIVNDTSVDAFIEDANMNVSTQASRANAFGNMYTFIKEQAKQFKGK